MWEAQSQEFHLSWKVASTQGLQASRQKESDVNTSFCCAIKSCWDTMGCCQSKRPRLTPLLLTLDPVSPHSPRHQMICAQELCIETMLSTKAGQCIYSVYSQSSSQRVTEGGLWVNKWEEVDAEQRKQLWKSLGLMEISSTTSFLQSFFFVSDSVY